MIEEWGELSLISKSDDLWAPRPESVRTEENKVEGEAVFCTEGIWNLDVRMEKGFS